LPATLTQVDSVSTVRRVTQPVRFAWVVEDLIQVLHGGSVVKPIFGVLYCTFTYLYTYVYAIVRALMHAVSPVPYVAFTYLFINRLIDLCEQRSAISCLLLIYL